jgi:hypothetical protein
MVASGDYIVWATVLADLLQSLEMKRQAVSVEKLRPDRLGDLSMRLVQRGFRGGYVLNGNLVFCIHEAALMADLSFAVPVTAANIMFKTVLAKLVLGESVTLLCSAGAFCVASGVALLAI